MIGESSIGMNDQLTKQEVRQAFAAAQGEEGGNSSAPISGGPASLKHNQKMDFPEYVEAIARLGCLKWEEAQMPVVAKIEMACEAVAGATPPTVHHRPAAGSHK